jgi:hypothetical protein
MDGSSYVIHLIESLPKPLVAASPSARSVAFQLLVHFLRECHHLGGLTRMFTFELLCSAVREPNQVL